MNPIRIFLVDDHAVLRQAVSVMLGAESDMTVVGQAGTGREALAAVESARPEVVMLDIKMPEAAGLDVLRDLRRACPKARVIIFTMYENPAYVNAAIRAGASGYVLKSVGRDELLRAIRAVSAGGQFLHAEVTGPLLRRAALEAKLRPGGGGLTVRDVQVLECLADGKSNKEIAHALGISDETVKSHLKRLFEKLGVSDRTEAVAIALRQNLID
ncbi:MAG: response regulator transcription factor [Deltaproteobacteria bacterium]|nr:response regulator transcription factor [Deltaproteobacteria bacterium]